MVGTGSTLNDQGKIFQSLEFLDKTTLPAREMLYLALGNSIFKQMRDEVERWKIPMNAFRKLGKFPKRWIYRGMGSAMVRSFRFKQILQANLDFLTPWISAEDFESLYWGIGWYWGKRDYLKPSTGIRMIKCLDPAAAQFAEEGFYYFSSL